MPSTSAVLIVGSFATAVAIVVFSGQIVPAVFFALVGVIAIWMRVSSARADALIAGALAPRESDAVTTTPPAAPARTEGPAATGPTTPATAPATTADDTERPEPPRLQSSR